MFHFPAFPPHALYIQARVTGHDSCRVSPFGHPRITARLTAPRGLSRPPTSFIGSWCQGIHRAPLPTWPQRCSRPLCSSQATDRTPTRPTPTPGSRPDRGPRRDDTRTPTHGCPLRTQQRTPHHPPNHPHPTRDISSQQASTRQSAFHPRKPHPPNHTARHRQNQHHTHSRAGCQTRRVPLVNTPNRSPTLGDCHGVCSNQLS